MRSSTMRRSRSRWRWNRSVRACRSPPRSRSTRWSVSLGSFAMVAPILNTCARERFRDKVVMANSGSFSQSMACRRRFRGELTDRLLALQDDALALIDFIEPLFGCLSKRVELRLPFLLLFFQKTQSLADDFAGVAVRPEAT